jgi:hypothetical protein
MASRYRFISCHPVLGNMLHPKLDLIDAKWNWVLGGNGQLTAKITVPEDDVPRASIKEATTPWASAIYVKKQSDNSYPWGGPIIKRTWNRRSGQIDITAVEWRSWLYMVIMDPFTDSDRFYTFVNQDQLIIARTLVQDVTLFGAVTGCPPIDYDFSLLSGKYRDLNFYGTQMIRAGNAIDSMANRDGGFEWTLGIKPNTTNGLPRLSLDLGYPERGSFIDGLHFKSTQRGSNCEPGDVTEDASQQYNRFWTTGAGQPPDQMFSYDFLPNLGGAGVLRLDGSASYPSVIERNTLFSHARRARKFYSDGTQTIPVEHNWGQIDPDSYQVGDRGRLQIKDRLTDIDLSAARVVSKEVSNSGAGSVKVIVDLTDYTLPEVDAGGVV